jgi:hypothetical protein
MWNKNLPAMAAHIINDPIRGLILKPCKFESISSDSEKKAAEKKIHLK